MLISCRTVQKHCNTSIKKIAFRDILLGEFELVAGLGENRKQTALVRKSTENIVGF